MARKLSTFERISKDILKDIEAQAKPAVSQNVRQKYRSYMNMIAQRYEQETLKWLDKVERKGIARRDVRQALHDAMYTKKGKRRKDFSDIRRNIARIEHIKSLTGSTSYVAVRNFKLGDATILDSADMPTLYVKKRKGETNAQALARETTRRFRSYQRELLAYKKDKGTYKGFPRGTGDMFVQQLYRLSNLFPEAFTISDTSDIIGTFKIHPDKFKQYDEEAVGFHARTLLEYTSMSPEGQKARKIGIAASQARLERRYPNVAKVVAQFNAAGVDLDKLRDILNSNMLAGYFMGYLNFQSEQYRTARVNCRQKVMREAKTPTVEKDADGKYVYSFMSIDASAFTEFISLVEACDDDWEDSASGAKLQAWFEEHVGDSYFLS